MTEATKKTLRLLMPQWQGGNLPAYHLGAQLLAWLAPPATGPVAEVKVDQPTNETLPIEGGIVARTALLKQADAARAIIEEHAPDKIVVLGGDCLIDLAPFAYLNERYDGDLAILWVDSHPDVITPEHFKHAHAMVLGNLMGEGDAEFVERVKKPISPRNVMYAGMDDMNEVERSILARLNLKSATPAQLRNSSEPIISWLKATGARHLAIHLDLDVLDPKQFRALLFSNPKSSADEWAHVPQGKMSIEEVVRLLNDVDKEVDIVGLGIAEHLPWDAIALRQMLRDLPLVG